MRVVWIEWTLLCLIQLYPEHCFIYFFSQSFSDIRRTEGLLRLHVFPAKCVEKNTAYAKEMFTVILFSFCVLLFFSSNRDWKSNILFFMRSFSYIENLNLCSSHIYWHFTKILPLIQWIFPSFRLLLAHSRATREMYRDVDTSVNQACMKIPFPTHQM